jgi:F0F1-type ATP synthase assembly protein I
VRRPHHDVAAIAANDSMSRGMEIAGTTAVFFLIGFALDRVVGTTPWLMVGFVLLGVIGQFARSYYVYNAAMAVHEQRRAQAAQARPIGDQS